MIDMDALRAVAGDAVRKDGATIATPHDAATAASTMTLCAERGWHVQPSGAGTWCNRPAEPSGEFVLLSTARLDGIEEYQPEDLTITVGAGTLITTLAETLARNNQFLPLDPPQKPGATIGGLVATGTAGPLRARYGTPRDHVLGLDIITGDGRSLHFGGRVVKNVAGYDMVRPIVGSNGTLGLITKVSLRLRPLHAVDATVAFDVSYDTMVDAAEAASDAWPVAALELLSPCLASALGVARAAGAAGDATWTLLVRLHGHQTEIDEAVRRLHRGIPASIRTVERDVWNTLSAHEASATKYVRTADRRSLMRETIARAVSSSDRANPFIAVHAADGIVRSWDGDAGTDAGTDGRARSGALSRSSPPRADGRLAEINRGIIDVFDPAGILPGKWR